MYATNLATCSRPSWPCFQIRRGQIRTHLGDKTGDVVQAQLAVSAAAPGKHGAVAGQSHAVPLARRRRHDAHAPVQAPAQT